MRGLWTWTTEIAVHKSATVLLIKIMGMHPHIPLWGEDVSSPRSDMAVHSQWGPHNYREWDMVGSSNTTRETDDQS